MIILGVIYILAYIAGLIFCCVKRRSKNVEDAQGLVEEDAAPMAMYLN